ncbi:MAG: HD domain-containing protein, partial [Lachnospiraceae bacterium]|nr:HD domain-containing protein [Lachnospiraceae bacterium]
MKHVRVDILVPGMITAQDVISSANQLILPRGLVLTDKAIARLESYEIKTIRIEDPVDMEVEEVPEEGETVEEAKPIDQSLINDNSADNILDALNGLLGQASPAEPEPEIQVSEQEEPSHFEKIQASAEFKEFKEDFEENVSQLKNQINDIVEKNTPIDVPNMLGPTMDLLSTQKSSFGVFDMLHNMRNYDDPTYSHSVNVALICNVFGKWLGMPDRDVHALTLAGLLHDVGKLKIPENVIGKPANLTDDEYELVKTHTIEGFNIL